MVSYKKYAAELLGTFSLVFCGTGALTINEVTHGAVTHVGVAFCFGLIVMVMIYALGESSGAHFNPAVTLAFAINGNFRWLSVPGYLLGQSLGALMASFILYLIFPESKLLGATIPSGSAMQSFILEIVLSFFLIFVILRMAAGPKLPSPFAGFAIGSVVLLEAMFAGPISGASMNPFRSLAPALITGHTEFQWIYIIAPLLGAVLAIPFYRITKE